MTVVIDVKGVWPLSCPTQLLGAAVTLDIARIFHAFHSWVRIASKLHFYSCRLKRYQKNWHSSSFLNTMKQISPSEELLEPPKPSSKWEEPLLPPKARLHSNKRCKLQPALASVRRAQILGATTLLELEPFCFSSSISSLYISGKLPSLSTTLVGELQYPSHFKPRTIHAIRQTLKLDETNLHTIQIHTVPTIPTVPQTKTHNLFDKWWLNQKLEVTS